MTHIGWANPFKIGFSMNLENSSSKKQTEFVLNVKQSKKK